jgi:hypothetical protein
MNDEPIAETAGDIAAEEREANPKEDMAERKAKALAEAQVQEQQVRRESAARTRRSFLVAAAGAAGGYGFYRWLDRSPQDGRVQRPLRKALNLNAAVSRAVFRDRGLAPTFPVPQSVELRVNGNYGIKQTLVPESYRLQMVGVENAQSRPQYADDVTAWEYRYAQAPETDAGHSTKVDPASEAKPGKQGGRQQRGQEEAGLSGDTLAPGTPGLLLKLEDVTRFARQELVTQFKCIEGWSEIVHWGGVRLADLLNAYPPAHRPDGSLPRYVYMETPNGDYYCGYDLEACLHPQSLLVTEMAGRPLAPAHGAPLRLHMPIKYGYKQIKCIGLIAYTDHQPDDYWTKLGYDWYAGL